MKRFSFLILAVAFMMANLQAQSAEIRRYSSDGRTLIEIEGQLNYGDEKEFISQALTTDKAIVVFRSNGGNLIAGIEIGKVIRLKGFVTYVADDQVCASACALAWLGGQRRFMSPSALIGFHAAYEDRNGVKRTSGMGNALVGAYLSQLGLSQEVILFITAAEPHELQRLSIAGANRLGIDVREFSLGTQDKSGSTSANPSQPMAPSRAVTPTPNEMPRTDFSQYGNYIQIYSLGTLDDGRKRLVEVRAKHPNALLFKSQNGMYAVVLGPFSAGSAANVRDRLRTAGTIPSDSYVTDGRRYLELFDGRVREVVP